MKALTKYENGSMAELWSVSWPLIVASAANMLMLFGDRLILSLYSSEAFNANVAAIPWIWTVYIPLYSIVFIACILVGRYNGAGTYEKIGPAVWQMLWLSLSLLVPLLPLSWYLAPHLLASNVRPLGTPYLRIILPSVPLSLAAFGAMAAFFTGRGKTCFVTVVALACNLINLCLDALLVFGFGPIPSMGIRGAAWGTVLSQVAALLLFAYFLFTKENGKNFCIFDARPNKKIFFECLRIGSPPALSCAVNFSLWSYVLQVMANQVDKDNFTAFGIATTVYHLPLFVVEGVSLGVGAIVANAYGAGNWKWVERNARSWFRVSLAVLLASFVLMVLCPGPLSKPFIHGQWNAAQMHTLRTMLFFSWLAIASESFGFNLRQTLTAFGDTVFTMLVGLIGYGCIVAVPSYFALHLTHNASSFLAIEAVGQISIAIAFFFRCQRHWFLPNLARSNKC
ncbi:MAG: hypothetical protein LBP65_02820 [Puniceicoccales bacterium]|jgi:MATE family multidrug resistance protein|nr:hypothetical protein [Puniceicoccales bacterium]